MQYQLKKKKDERIIHVRSPMKLGGPQLVYWFSL